MTISTKWHPAFYASAACLFAFALSPLARAETKTSEDAQALLQDAKSRAAARQVAAKQTELNRLNEDVAKARKESEDLQKSIKGIETATEEASNHAEELAGTRTRLKQALEITTLRIDAQKAKLEGLKALGDAQTKVLNTLSSRTEELDLRAAIEAAGLKLLSESSSPENGEAAATYTAKIRSDIAEQKKKLEKSERTISMANTAAREAMTAATAKLQLADAAAAKARKRADELGLPETDETPVEREAQHVPKASPVH